MARSWRLLEGLLTPVQRERERAREPSFTTMQPTFSSPEHLKTFDSRSHALPIPDINKIRTLLAQTPSATRRLVITIAQIPFLYHPHTAPPLSAPSSSSSSTTNHNHPAIFFCIQLLTRQSGDSWSPRDCCKQVENASLARDDPPNLKKKKKRGGKKRQASWAKIQEPGQKKRGEHGHFLSPRFFPPLSLLKPAARTEGARASTCFNKRRFHFTDRLFTSEIADKRHYNVS